MQSYVFFRNQTTFATILPQISISGGALVSARLCRLPEQEVHQPSKQWSSHRLHGSAQNFLQSGASHRLHRFTQKLLTSGGALVSSAPTEQEVHQPSNIDIPLVTLVHLRQVHPLTLAVNSVQSVGESSHPNNLCRSVKSVGEYPQQEFL